MLQTRRVFDCKLLQPQREATSACYLCFEEEDRGKNLFATTRSGRQHRLSGNGSFLLDLQTAEFRRGEGIFVEILILDHEAKLRIEQWRPTKFRMQRISIFTTRQSKAENKFDWIWRNAGKWDRRNVCLLRSNLAAMPEIVAVPETVGDGISKFLFERFLLFRTFHK